MKSPSTALTHAPTQGLPAPQPGRPGEAEPNPLLLMHGLLRGRYLLTAVLALGLAAAGAAIAFKAVPPEYESRALLRLAPVLPKVLYESEENQMMPMFEAFIETQVSVMRSRRVIEMAMQSPAWRDAGGDFSLDAIEEFTEGLVVAHPKNSQMIEVSFKHDNPAVSQAAVKSVVNAFVSIYGETDLRTETQRLQLLEERHKALTGQIEAIRGQILEIANEFGSNALEGMFAFKLEELQKLESQLKEAKMVLLAATPRVAESGAMASEEPWATDANEEALARVDPYLRRLVEERNRARVEMEAKGAQVGRQHRSYTAAADHLRSFEAAVERYIATLPASTIETGAADGPVSFATGAGLDVKKLKSRIELLQTTYDRAKEESLNLGRKNLQIEKLRADLATLEERLATTNSRIEQLNVESAVGGRISVVSEAESPLAAANSRRRLQVTVLGGLAGFALGASLVMLGGLVNPRIRDCVDAGGSKLRLLGVLPTLPADLDDPAQAMVAAQCVHQLRVMLQVQVQQHAARVFAITSADSGTGKTSITLSLGLSMAASGVRTLVVDGDLVGMGLTRRTETIARRKLGQILLNEGLIDKDRLEQGLLMAKESGMPLGRALVVLGYVSQADLDQNLARQRDMRLGLADAVRGVGLDECVTQIGVPNLHVLPAGWPNPGHVTALSPESMARLVNDMRASYDVVLIDTGPVPGSTDASIITAGADRVIVVASRGESHTQVHHALQHLDSMRASVLGLVFNRARSWDLARSGQFSATSGSSVYAIGDDPEALKARAQRLEEYMKYGPLPQAVVADIPATNPQTGAASALGVTSAA